MLHLPAFWPKGPTAAQPSSAATQSLARLPEDVLLEISSHLTRTDMMRLRNVNRRLHAVVGQVVAGVPMPPGGVYPPLDPAPNTLGAWSQRKTVAYANMRLGLAKQDEISDYSPYFGVDRDGGNEIAVSDSSTRFNLVSLDLVDPRGFGVLCSQILEGQDKSDFKFRTIENFVYTSKDRHQCAFALSYSASGSAYYKDALTPQIWHVTKGASAKRYTFSEPKAIRAGSARCTLGADGNTAVTSGPDSMIFWRLNGSIFEPEKRYRNNSFSRLSGLINVCPSTGRLVVGGEDSWSFRTEEGHLTAPVPYDTRLEFPEFLFSPDGKQLLLHSTTPIGREEHEHVTCLYDIDEQPGSTPEVRHKFTSIERNRTQTEYNWAINSSGAWKVRAHMNRQRVWGGTALAQHAQIKTLKDHDGIEPTSGRSAQLAKAYRSAQSRNCGIIGSDLDGNIYHIFDKTIFSQSWLYRIDAETGGVTRTHFNSELAKKINETVQGPVTWSLDGTSMQYQGHERVLHYLDFSTAVPSPHWVETYASATQRLGVALSETAVQLTATVLRENSKLKLGVIGLGAMGCTLSLYALLPLLSLQTSTAVVVQWGLMSANAATAGATVLHAGHVIQFAAILVPIAAVTMGVACTLDFVKARRLFILPEEPIGENRINLATLTERTRQRMSADCGDANASSSRALAG